MRTQAQGLGGQAHVLGRTIRMFPLSVSGMILVMVCKYSITVKCHGWLFLALGARTPHCKISSRSFGSTGEVVNTLVEYADDMKYSQPLALKATEDLLITAFLSTLLRQKGSRIK